MYRIELSEDAKDDLSYLEAYERKIVIDKIRTHLSHEPGKETRNRKRLRDNPIGPWELRIDRVRVFYSIEEDIVVVSVVSVGWKTHNTLYIRGKEVRI
ncbi:MAG TPA: type II toxin-antitoxin system RelE/ParE family toxin [Thermoanaerobaculia bacterium]